MDFSQEMIKYMLLPELPELPESENELTKSLFPQQHGKIPGEKKTYLAIKRQWPLDAESFLIEADGSELPLKLSELWMPIIYYRVSEMETSISIAYILRRLFYLF
jgi:hypothetical protein